MIVYVGADDRYGYVRFGECGPALVVGPDGVVDQEFVERVEMFDPYEEREESNEDPVDVDNVLALLEGQAMPHHRRLALAEVLGVDLDRVGRAR